MMNMDWHFSVGDEVYHPGRNQNGIVISCIYYQFKDRVEYEYNVCFQNGGSAEYIATSAAWLQKDHKDIID